MRVLVTGSRSLENRTLVEDALQWVAFDTSETELITVVHGACPGGADAFASDWTETAFNTEEEAHPADFAGLGPKAGPLRNQEMVDLGADICLAFPVEGSRGTWDCIRRARAAGIPVEIHGEKK